MRLSGREIDDYLLDLTELAERYGVEFALAEGRWPIVEVDNRDVRRITVSGTLPAAQPNGSAIKVSEIWRPIDTDAFERSAYLYELVDHERGFRRAFHRHHEKDFLGRYGVVVHEHCESPLGTAPCPHLFGPPVRDGFRALELLMTAWISDQPRCADLPCLELI
ncbi:MAG: hypothetical protein ABI725_00485 [Chloroflexota bacterium]